MLFYHFEQILYFDILLLLLLLFYIIYSTIFDKFSQN